MHMFRVDREPYIPGSTIAPGYFGVTALRYENLRVPEIVFEAIRREVVPDAPSRMHCVFAYDTEASAIAHGLAYNTHRRASGSPLYEWVHELEFPDAATPFRADMAWLTNKGTIRVLHELQAMARGYWAGLALDAAEPIWEWLIGATGVVVSSARFPPMPVED